MVEGEVLDPSELGRTAGRLIMEATTQSRDSMYDIICLELLGASKGRTQGGVCYKGSGLALFSLNAPLYEVRSKMAQEKLRISSCGALCQPAVPKTQLLLSECFKFPVPMVSATLVEAPGVDTFATCGQHAGHPMPWSERARHAFISSDVGKSTLRELASVSRSLLYNSSRADRRVLVADTQSGAKRTLTASSLIPEDPIFTRACGLLHKDRQQVDLAIILDQLAHMRVHGALPNLGEYGLEEVEARAFCMLITKQKLEKDDEGSSGEPDMPPARGSKAGASSGAGAAAGPGAAKKASVYGRASPIASCKAALKELTDLYAVPRGINKTATEYIRDTPSHPLHEAFAHPWRLHPDGSDEQKKNDEECDKFDEGLAPRRKRLITLAVCLAARTFEAMPSANHTTDFVFRILRKFGLPVRYMGLVRSQCVKPHVRMTILRAMVAELLAEVCIEVSRTEMRRQVRAARETLGLNEEAKRKALQEGMREAWGMPFWKLPRQRKATRESAWEAVQRRHPGLLARLKEEISAAKSSDLDVSGSAADHEESVAAASASTSGGGAASGAGSCDPPTEDDEVLRVRARLEKSLAFEHPINEWGGVGPHPSVLSAVQSPESCIKQFAVDHLMAEQRAVSPAGCMDVPDEIVLQIMERSEEAAMQAMYWLFELDDNKRDPATLGPVSYMLAREATGKAGASGRIAELLRQLGMGRGLDSAADEALCTKVLGGLITPSEFWSHTLKHAIAAMYDCHNLAEASSVCSLDKDEQEPGFDPRSILHGRLLCRDILRRMDCEPSRELQQYLDRTASNQLARIGTRRFLPDAKYMPGAKPHPLSEDSGQLSAPPAAILQRLQQLEASRASMREAGGMPVGSMGGLAGMFAGEKPGAPASYLYPTEQDAVLEEMNSNDVHFVRLHAGEIGGKTKDEHGLPVQVAFSPAQVAENRQRLLHAFCLSQQRQEVLRFAFVGNSRLLNSDGSPEAPPLPSLAPDLPGRSEVQAGAIESLTPRQLEALSALDLVDGHYFPLLRKALEKKNGKDVLDVVADKQAAFDAIPIEAAAAALILEAAESPCGKELGIDADLVFADYGAQQLSPSFEMKPWKHRSVLVYHPRNLRVAADIMHTYETYPSTGLLSSAPLSTFASEVNHTMIALHLQMDRAPEAATQTSLEQISTPLGAQLANPLLLRCGAPFPGHQTSKSTVVDPRVNQALESLAESEGAFESKLHSAVPADHSGLSVAFLAAHADVYARLGATPTAVRIIREALLHVAPPKSSNPHTTVSLLLQLARYLRKEGQICGPELREVVNQFSNVCVAPQQSPDSFAARRRQQRMEDRDYVSRWVRAAGIQFIALVARHKPEAISDSESLLKSRLKAQSWLSGLQRTLGKSVANSPFVFDDSGIARLSREKMLSSDALLPELGDASDPLRLSLSLHGEIHACRHAAASLAALQSHVEKDDRHGQPLSMQEALRSIQITSSRRPLDDSEARLPSRCPGELSCLPAHDVEARLRAVSIPKASGPSNMQELYKGGMLSLLPAARAQSLAEPQPDDVPLNTALQASLVALSIATATLGPRHPLRLAAMIQVDQCFPTINDDLIKAKVQLQVEIAACCDALHGRGSLESASSRLELALTLARCGAQDYPASPHGKYFGVRETETAAALVAEVAECLQACTKLHARHYDGFYAGLRAFDRVVGEDVFAAETGFLCLDLPRPSTSQDSIAISWSTGRPTSAQLVEMAASSQPPLWIMSEMKSRLFEVMGLLAPSPSASLAACQRSIEALAQPLEVFVAEGLEKCKIDADAPVSEEYARSTWNDASSLGVGQVCNSGTHIDTISGILERTEGHDGSPWRSWVAVDGLNSAQLHGQQHCSALLVAARAARRSYREACRSARGDASLHIPAGKDVRVPAAVMLGDDDSRADQLAREAKSRYESSRKPTAVVPSEAMGHRTGMLRSALAMTMLALDLQLNSVAIQNPEEHASKYRARMHRPYIPEQQAETIGLAISLLLELDVAERQVPLESRLYRVVNMASARACLSGSSKSEADAASKLESARLSGAMGRGGRAAASGAGAGDMHVADSLESAAEIAPDFRAEIAGFAAMMGSDVSPELPADATFAAALRTLAHRADVYESIEWQIAMQLLNVAPMDFSSFGVESAQVSAVVGISVSTLISRFAVGVLRGTFEDRKSGFMHPAIKQSGLYFQVHPSEGPINGLENPVERMPDGEAPYVDWMSQLGCSWNAPDAEGRGKRGYTSQAFMMRACCTLSSLSGQNSSQLPEVGKLGAASKTLRFQIPVDEPADLPAASSSVRVAEYLLAILDSTDVDKDAASTLLDECQLLAQAPLECCSFEQLMDFAELSLAVGVSGQIMSFSQHVVQSNEISPPVFADLVDAALSCGPADVQDAGGIVWLGKNPSPDGEEPASLAREWSRIPSLQVCGMELPEFIPVCQRMLLQLSGDPAGSTGPDKPYRPPQYRWSDSLPRTSAACSAQQSSNCYQMQWCAAGKGSVRVRPGWFSQTSTAAKLPPHWDAGNIPSTESGLRRTGKLNFQASDALTLQTSPLGSSRDLDQYPRHQIAVTLYKSGWPAGVEAKLAVILVLCAANSPVEGGFPPLAEVGADSITLTDSVELYADRRQLHRGFARVLERVEPLRGVLALIFAGDMDAAQAMRTLQAWIVATQRRTTAATNRKVLQADVSRGSHAHALLQRSIEVHGSIMKGIQAGLSLAGLASRLQAREGMTGPGYFTCGIAVAMANLMSPLEIRVHVRWIGRPTVVVSMSASPPHFFHNERPSLVRFLVLQQLQHVVSQMVEFSAVARSRAICYLGTSESPLADMPEGVSVGADDPVMRPLTAFIGSEVDLCASLEATVEAAYRNTQLVHQHAVNTVMGMYAPELPEAELQQMEQEAEAGTELGIPEPAEAIDSVLLEHGFDCGGFMDPEDFISKEAGKQHIAVNIGAQVGELATVEDCIKASRSVQLTAMALPHLKPGRRPQVLVRDQGKDACALDLAAMHAFEAAARLADAGRSSASTAKLGASTLPMTKELAGAVSKPLARMIGQVKDLMKSGEMPSQCRLAAPEFAEAVWMLGEAEGLPSFQAFALMMFFLNSPVGLPPESTAVREFSSRCGRGPSDESLSWGISEACSHELVSLHERWGTVSERCLGLPVQQWLEIQVNSLLGGPTAEGASSSTSTDGPVVFGSIAPPIMRQALYMAVVDAYTTSGVETDRRRIIGIPLRRLAWADTFNGPGRSRLHKITAAYLNSLRELSPDAAADACRQFRMNATLLHPSCNPEVFQWIITDLMPFRGIGAGECTDPGLATLETLRSSNLDRLLASTAEQLGQVSTGLESIAAVLENSEIEQEALAPLLAKLEVLKGSAQAWKPGVDMSESFLDQIDLGPTKPELLRQRIYQLAAMGCSRLALPGIGVETSDQMAHAVGQAAIIGLADWHMLAYFVTSLMQCRFERSRMYRLLRLLMGSFRASLAARDEYDARGGALQRAAAELRGIVDSADDEKIDRLGLAMEPVAKAIAQFVESADRWIQATKEKPDMSHGGGADADTEIRILLEQIRDNFAMAESDPKQVGFFAVQFARYAIGCGPSDDPQSYFATIPRGLFASLEDASARTHDVQISENSDILVRLSMLPIYGLAVCNSAHGRTATGNVPVLSKCISRSTVLDTSVMDLFWPARVSLSQVNFIAVFLSDPGTRRILLDACCEGQQAGLGQFDLCREIDERHARILQLHEENRIFASERAWGHNFRGTEPKTGGLERQAASAAAPRSLADMLPRGVPLDQVPRELICPREADLRWTTTATHTREASGAYRDWINVSCMAIWGAWEHRDVLKKIRGTDLLRKMFQLTDCTCVGMFQHVESGMRGVHIACVASQNCDAGETDDSSVAAARPGALVSGPIAYAAMHRLRLSQYLAGSPARGIFDEEAPSLAALSDLTRVARGTAAGETALAAHRAHTLDIAETIPTLSEFITAVAGTLSKEEVLEQSLLLSQRCLLFVARVDRRLTSWMCMLQAGVTVVTATLSASTKAIRSKYLRQAIELGYVPLLAEGLRQMDALCDCSVAFMLGLVLLLNEAAEVAREAVASSNASEDSAWAQLPCLPAVDDLDAFISAHEAGEKHRKETGEPLGFVVCEKRISYAEFRDQVRDSLVQRLLSYTSEKGLQDAPMALSLLAMVLCKDGENEEGQAGAASGAGAAESTCPSGADLLHQVRSQLAEVRHSWWLMIQLYYGRPEYQLLEKLGLFTPVVAAMCPIAAPWLDWLLEAELPDSRSVATPFSPKMTMTLYCVVMEVLGNQTPLNLLSGGRLVFNLGLKRLQESDCSIVKDAVYAAHCDTFELPAGECGGHAESSEAASSGGAATGGAS